MCPENRVYFYVLTNICNAGTTESELVGILVEEQYFSILCETLCLWVPVIFWRGLTLCGKGTTSLFDWNSLNGPCGVTVSNHRPDCIERFQVCHDICLKLVSAELLLTPGRYKKQPNLHYDAKVPLMAVNATSKNVPGSNWAWHEKHHYDLKC